MAETTDKKAKAPAKTAAAKPSGDSTTTPRKTAAKSTKKAAPAETNGNAGTPSHEEIARLAEKYWAERGHQHGHDEQDWLRAERELTTKAS